VKLYDSDEQVAEMLEDASFGRSKEGEEEDETPSCVSSPQADYDAFSELVDGNRKMLERAIQ
jgi:hypothetical protein